MPRCTDYADTVDLVRTFASSIRRLFLSTLHTFLCAIMINGGSDAGLSPGKVCPVRSRIPVSDGIYCEFDLLEACT